MSAGVQDERLIRDISDTALWAAWYRANETAREDAVFRDPFAMKLAGERGRQIAKHMKFSTRHSWSWVARTYLFDHMILEQIGLGVDMVVNLACGLDSRPYRMNLPQDLQWVEVDLPSILDYKEEVMQGVKPECRFERMRVDLADKTARRELFARLAARAKNILVVTEGLITYFSEDEVAEFAKDLAANRSYQRWLTDLANPALIKLLNKRMGKDLAAAGALRFGPALGTKFFEPYGWKGLDVRSTLACAAKIKRLPRLMKLMTMVFPDSKGRNERQPWSGAVMLGRK